MAASRRFGTCLLGVTAIVLFLEGALLVRARSAADRAAVRWKARLGERSEFETLSPAPSRENAARLEANLAAARRVLTQAAAKLCADVGKDADEASSTPTDTFFELAAFVARLRQRAEEEGVVLSPGERFGFSAYAEEPPAAELVPRVLRQERYAEAMLQLLFEARPERLVSFQREIFSAATPGRPATIGARQVTPMLSRPAQDYFTPDPQRTLQRAGLVESSAFRMVFTGGTRALRSFLNSVAAAPLPLVVRSVEIEPVGGETGSGARPRWELSASVMLAGNSASPENPDSAVTIPVIIPTASKYTVILEVVNFVGKSADDAPARSPVFG